MSNCFVVSVKRKGVIKRQVFYTEMTARESLMKHRKAEIWMKSGCKTGSEN
ncbi:MAG: hypothetical protein U0V04_04810 [Spirosomataceae bacterium]